MNDNLTNERLSPERVITIYHNKSRSKFYLESREINNVNGKNILSAAIPLSDEVMKEIASAYTNENKVITGFGEIIPSHLLHGSNKNSKTVVIWYRPSMEKTLNFSASLNIKGDCLVHIPATLYMVIDNKLYIYALMNSDRPDRKTKLYKAPFFNIYSDGNVCLGSARVGNKTKTFDGEANRFENAFYMAEQTGGLNFDNCKTKLETLWRRLIKSKEPFPSKTELRQHTKYKTLGDLIDKMI